MGATLKIEVAGRIRYPDAFIICRPVAPADTVIADPVVVFEILSESSTNTDLIDKNQEYRATPSVRRYAVLEQTHAAAVVFVRKGDDWVSEIVSGQDSTLRMPEIGVEIPLSELYEGIQLAEAGVAGTSDTAA